jgi:diaminopropionate ammonia-lyase
MTPQQSWYARDARGWTCAPPDGDAAAFHRALPGYAVTPLVELPALAATLGVGRLLVKDESARFDLRAFKFLGASWAGFRAVAARTGYAGPATLDALRAHLAAGPGTGGTGAVSSGAGGGDAGAASGGAGSVGPAGGGALALVTATDGNHGRAVARTARLLGLPARVYVPKGVPGLVIDRIRAEGATVTVVDADYDGAVRMARADAEGGAGAGGGSGDGPGNGAGAGRGGGADGGSGGGPDGGSGAGRGGSGASHGGGTEGGSGEAAGAVLIQDTAWPGYEQIPGWIVAGYETLFAELDAQLAAAGVGGGSGGDGSDGGGSGGGPVVLSVPVGVGSLAQAAVAHYRSRAAGGRSMTRLLGVEPDTAACVLRSLAEGALVSVPTGATVMNGLNCGTPSSLAWPYLRDGMDAAIAVTDAQAQAALAALAAAGISAGPSAAAALAGPLAALAGPGARSRRRDLGLDDGAAVDERAVVVCLSTEGPLSAPGER